MTMCTCGVVGVDFRYRIVRYFVSGGNLIRRVYSSQKCVVAILARV